MFEDGPDRTGSRARARGLEGAGLGNLSNVRSVRDEVEVNLG